MTFGPVIHSIPSFPTGSGSIESRAVIRARQPGIGRPTVPSRASAGDPGRCLAGGMLAAMSGDISVAP